MSMGVEFSFLKNSFRLNVMAVEFSLLKNSFRLNSCGHVIRSRSFHASKIFMLTLRLNIRGLMSTQIRVFKSPPERVNCDDHSFIYNRSSNMNYFIYTSHHFAPHGN